MKDERWDGKLMSLLNSPRRSRPSGVAVDAQPLARTRVIGFAWARALSAPAAVCALAAALACGQPPEQTGPTGTGKPFDVILISLDSVRADSLTFRDAHATPHLTKLAQRGTVFTQAVSGTSWTLPAHVEMMTGAPPPLHGVEDGDLRIDPMMPLLAEQLKQAGYFTAGFFTAGYLWGDYGFARGFDVYESAIHERDLQLEDASFVPRGAAGDQHRKETAGSQSSSSPSVRQRVDRLLSGLAPERPLFLFLHLFDPHYDYIPPAPYDTRFDLDYEGTLDGRNFLRNPRIWDESLDPPRRVGDRDLAHLFALYRGEIAWTDKVLGEIFERLDAAGRLENALVIVTADHGEEFFEHGRRGHRQTLYDEVLRVPLLVRPPAGAAAREVDAQVSLSDLMPTLLDYAGLETPDSVHGRSLRAAIEGERILSRPALSTLYVPAPGRRGRQHHHLLQTVRTPEAKLLRHVSVSAAGRVRVPEVLYFDLQTDPHELRPVVDRADPRVRESWQLLEREFEAVRTRWARLPHTPDEERTTDMVDVLFEELAALGYVDTAPKGTHPVLGLPWGLAPPPEMPLDDDSG